MNYKHGQLGATLDGAQRQDLIYMYTKLGPLTWSVASFGYLGKN